MSGNPLEIAKQLELDGIDYYTKAANNSKSELIKGIFLSLIKDEERHLAIIQEMANSETFNSVPTDNFKLAIKTIFTDAKDVPTELGTEQEALQVAVELELKGINYYTNHADTANSDHERQMFLMLVEEEKLHYQALFNTQRYLENASDWYMLEENWSFDGG